MLCFTKFPRATKFMDQRRGGEYQAFPSKTSCLTVPKISVGEPFCGAFQKNHAGEKVSGSEERREGSIITFRRKFFV